MCGIAGQLRFDSRTPDEGAMASMRDAILHRGPDDQGIAIERNAGMVSCRLAIQDLSAAGHMPMEDSTGRFLIVFNGEIYNFLDLRAELVAAGAKLKSHSDTEVVLELYRMHGPDALKRLRGMFAIAIWDRTEGSLFLARDRFGKKPLKYWMDDTRIVFSSELKGILADRSIPRVVDWEAIDEYLAYHYVPAPRTGFAGIKKLPPATWMLVSTDGAVRQETYWSLSFEPKVNQDETTWLKEMDAGIRESVRLRLISDVPVGAHLSGGIDSSLVVSYMAELASSPVQTFSMGFDEPDYDERRYARLVSDRYRTEHHEFLVAPQNLVDLTHRLAYAYEEPYADSSALPSWLLAEHTRAHVKVALNGDGGDELFGGYRRYQALLMYRLGRRFGLGPFAPSISAAGGLLYRVTGHATAHRMQRFGASLAMDEPTFFRDLVQLFNAGERASFYTPELARVVRGSRANSLITRYWQTAAALSSVDRMYAADIATSLADGLLPKVDIASMAHGVEIRSPFLDQELAERAARMPSRLKTSATDAKILLKKIARQRLPAACIDRPKQGFSVPLEHWFRGDLAEYIRAELTDPAFTGLGFVPTEMERILDEHVHRVARHDQRLWGLLMLKRWLAAYDLLA